MKKVLTPLLAAASLVAIAATPAHAQSTEEVLGTVLGGTLGSVIGGEIDGGRNNTDGQVIGALVGGSLGYVIGDRVDDRNDDQRRYRQYQTRTQSYNRGYQDARFQSGYPRTVYRSQPVYSQPRYRTHHVHGQHPGRGHAYGRRQSQPRYYDAYGRPVY